MPIDLGIPKSQQNYFSFEEGNNKVRVLDMSNTSLNTHFAKGATYQCPGEETCPFCKLGKKPSWKKVAYLFDYKTNSIQLAFLPKSVLIELENLSSVEGFAYDNLPMPYDVTVKYTQNAAPKDKYKTYGVPKFVPVPEDIMTEMEKRKPLDQIVESIALKQVMPADLEVTPEAEPEEVEPVHDEATVPVNPDDIPF